MRVQLTSNPKMEKRTLAKKDTIFNQGKLKNFQELAEKNLETKNYLRAIEIYEKCNFSLLFLQFLCKFSIFPCFYIKVFFSKQAQPFTLSSSDKKPAISGNILAA
jgi:hypothetical protein